MGRPTILTPELTAHICKLVADGLPKDKVCWAVGVSDTVLYQWIDKGSGEDAEEPYRSFVVSLKKAEADFLSLVRQKVESEKDWTRWAWLGERLQPATFGKTDRVTLGDTAIPILGIVALVPNSKSQIMLDGGNKMKQLAADVVDAEVST